MRVAAIAASTLAMAVFGALLFLVAGRIDIPSFWIYLSMWGAYVTTSSLRAMRQAPAVLAGPPQLPTRRDLLMAQLAAAAGLGHFVVAGLDVGRFGWSSVPLLAQLGGFALLGAAMIVVILSLKTDRAKSNGEPQGGLAAILRNPKYLSALFLVVGSGPALGSWWAMLAVLPIIPILVLRAQHEDRARVSG